MYLSEIKQVIKNIDIIRNNSFDTLGLIGNKYIDENVMTFIEDKKYLQELINNKRITCVISSKNIAKDIFNIENIGICITENPREAFYKFHNYLARNTSFYGKKEDNVISKSAKIHHTVSLGENNIKIGDRVIIEPHVTILNNVEIGDDVIIRAGVVVGSDPFQYLKMEDQIMKVDHVGSVKIHNNVEIKSNACIDIGVFNNATEVGEYSIISNLSHINHDVKIGKRCLVGANAIISGYAIIDDDTWIGPSSCIRNRVSIGKRAKISMGAVVTKDVEDDKAVSGNFAIDHNKLIEFIKSIR